MKDILAGEITEEERYQIALGELKELFRYGLTPSEAVDYLAVRKNDVKPTNWAKVRAVSSQAVSGNVSSAEETINISRLDAEVIEKDSKVIVRVRDRDDERHELPFNKQSSVHFPDDEARLIVVYEAMSAVHGYYESVEDPEQEYEATLWFDGRPTNSFEEFDFGNHHGSPYAKADTILWERPTSGDNSTEEADQE